MKLRRHLHKAAFIVLLFLSAFAGGSMQLLAQDTLYRTVPGTQYRMVLPEGFKTAKNLSGFRHAGKDASIILTELPASVQSLIATYTPLLFQSKGMKLLNKEEIEFDSLTAVMLTVSEQKYLKHMFVFGDKSKAVVAAGIYPASEKELGETIKMSLLSVKPENSRKSDPLEVFGFKLAINPNLFKLAMTFQGGMIYTVDGNINSKTILLIATENSGHVPAVGRRDFALDKVRKVRSAAQYEVKAVSPVKIDDLSGVEIITSGKNSKEHDESIYQVVLFDEAGKYYTITGVASDDIQVSLSRFKTIAYTFKRK